MSEYQRFISYMYEYRNGKKSTNCGYARVENRNRLCRLEIHMKTSPQTLEEPLRIYGCFHQDGQLFGILLGQHAPVLDMINWRYQGDPDNLNASRVPLSQLEGLILSDGSQIAYCSMWNDTVINPNQMTPYSKEEPASAQEPSPKKADSPGVTLKGNENASASSPEHKTDHTEYKRKDKKTIQSPLSADTAGSVDETPKNNEHGQNLLQTDRVYSVDNTMVNRENRMDASAPGENSGQREMTSTEKDVSAAASISPDKNLLDSPAADALSPENTPEEPLYTTMSDDEPAENMISGNPSDINTSGNIPDSDFSASNIPDSNVPDSNIPCNSVPDSNIPCSNVSDNNILDNNIPDNNIPDNNIPDNNISGSNISDNNIPGSNIPCNDVPDSNILDDNISGSNISCNDVPDRDFPDSDYPDWQSLADKTPSDPIPGNSILSDSAETASQVSRLRDPEHSLYDDALTFQKSQPDQNPVAATTARPSAQPPEPSSPWEQVQTAYPRINPFTDDEIQDCVRIELADLPSLRQNGWRIAGNRFILHSFQKNRHLVLGRLKNNGRYIFAVPGYYDNQERFMANMFGFPYFKSSDGGPLRYGQKGYWYRLLY